MSRLYCMGLFRYNMNLPGIGWTVATICWMILIFYLSSLSGQELDHQFHPNPVSWIAHVVLFATLAVLLQLAIRGWHFEINLCCVIAVAAFCSLFGISDEYHQSFVTGRQATVADALINSLSSMISAALMWLISRSTSSKFCRYRTVESKKLD